MKTTALLPARPPIRSTDLVRRGNPKRLAELCAALKELQDWAETEAKLETYLAHRRIWLAVRDWALGAAMQHKLTLDSGPVVLKAQTASAGLESPNERGQR